MVKKRYSQHVNKITVRSRDDPAEYARQYYWIAIKGKTKAPKRQRKRKGGKTKKMLGGKWSLKYKRSINCRKPKGFSQKQHCKYGRKK